MTELLPGKDTQESLSHSMVKRLPILKVAGEHDFLKQRTAVFS